MPVDAVLPPVGTKLLILPGHCDPVPPMTGQPRLDHRQPHQAAEQNGAEQRLAIEQQEIPAERAICQGFRRGVQPDRDEDLQGRVV